MVVVVVVVVGQEGGGMDYALQTHVEFTFNNQIIPHTCITIMVSNDV